MGLLTYLTAEDCPVELKLDVNFEDAGYQAYLLARSIASGVASEYISQYKKYRSWLIKQNRDPWFYWNSSNRTEGGAPLNLVSSSYAAYRSEVCLIDTLREKKIEDREKYSPVEEDSSSVLPSKKRCSETRLTKIASDITKVRRCPEGETSLHRFGTAASIGDSILYLKLRECKSDDERTNLVLKYLPCLSPVMDVELHQVIIKEAVSGVRDVKLLLIALKKYETILRDMMEEEGTLRVANICSIGRRPYKKYNPVTMNDDLICDILATERMRLRFLEKKYELKKERDLSIRQISRYDFIREEHEALLQRGAVDDFDYTELLQKVQLAGREAIEKRDEESLVKFLSIMNRTCLQLSLGIEEGLRSIGTGKLRPVRLI